MARSSFARGAAVVVCMSIALTLRVSALPQDPSLQVLYDFKQFPAFSMSGVVEGPDGTFYGTSVNAGLQPGGVFSLRPREDGSYEYRLLHEFTLSDQTGGALPYGGLAFGPDGHLYGTTMSGGVHDAGTVFRITAGGAFTSLHSFDGTSGRTPLGRLAQGADGSLYGTTIAGGTFDLGTIFRITAAGAFTHMHSFWWLDGAYPAAGLTLASDGNFYGTAASGGVVFTAPGLYTSLGTIFRMTPAGAVTPLYYLRPGDGNSPLGALTQASDGHLYGTAYDTDAESDGTVFRITTAGVFTRLHAFPRFSGHPAAGLVQANDGHLYGTLTGFSTFYDETQPHGSLFRISLAGATDIVHTFSILDGKLPYGDLIEASDGALYGGTLWGGAERNGSIFRYTPDDGISTVHSFRGRVDSPEGLIAGRDGHFYGVDRTGGPDLTGTIFKLSPDGTYTPLRTLLRGEGRTISPLLQAADGHFYGTTLTGGANGSGGVFRITADGEFTAVTSFLATDGLSGRPLVQAADGMFYGLREGGVNGSSVFKMTPGGVVSTVYVSPTFIPGQGIVQASDGHLYGIAEHGGPNQLGTVYRVTTTGTFTNLHTFSGGDGSRPVGRLAQGGDGFLYGTTMEGGSANLGTVFRISTSGVLTTLHSFTGADGGRPRAPLHLASDGFIYGTTNHTSEGLPGGVIFRIVPATGAVTIVRTFAADLSEGRPFANGVVQGTDGQLYGLTWNDPHDPGGPQAFFYRLIAGPSAVR